MSATAVRMTRRSSLPLCKRGGSASALPEKHYQVIAAKALDGQTEVTMGIAHAATS